MGFRSRRSESAGADLVRIHEAQVVAISLGSRHVGRRTECDVRGAGTSFLDHRWSAHGESAWRYFGSVEKDRIRSDDGAAADDDPMHDDGAVADQGVVLDGATLEVHDVADHAVVAHDRREHVRGVQDAAVLDGRAFADDDVAVVAAQHRPRPDGAVGADAHSADDDCVGMDVGVGMNDRTTVTQGVDGHAGTLPESGSDRVLDDVLPTRPIGLERMSRRIDIELTSNRPDGSWTWRAAGAREPKGVLDGSVLPGGAKTGDVLKVDAEFDIDGITILGVVHGRTKVDKRELITLVSDDKAFEPVTQQLARRSDSKGRGEGRGRGEGKARGDRRPKPQGDDRRPRQSRPRFEAPPEIPQRPRPKRLRPGTVHRKAVLEELPADQRPIAELALHGMQTVRQKLKEANAALTEAGKPVMPEQSVLQMAENLLPRLRVADWLDRAQAAKKDLAELDLKDLRSVVAAANDPLIERAEHCRELVAELRQGLTVRAEEEYRHWLEDIEASLGVGRLVRALKLSGQPPKAGAIFPDDLGRRLSEATSASLVADALADRWIAILEAVAFAPIRSLVKITSKPETLAPELVKTVQRLGALVPQIATALGIETSASGPSPKPLRPTRPAAKGAKKLPPRPPKPAPAATDVPKPAPAAADVPTAATVAADELAAGRAAVEAPVTSEADVPAAASE